ncbi:MAG: AmmeMemoRadiSam system protein B [Candidatus Shapirobacteria bacterium]
MGITDEFIASKSVGDCFREAVSKKFDGKLKGLIVPHAGYIYSGSVAAAGYRLMKKGDYDRVIVIGFYHGGMEEHSVKVQIPLIKYILGEEIKIEEKYIDKIINFEVNNRTMVVASSDLSHYQSLMVAKKLDERTIKAILSQDEEKICREANACGIWPILTINRLAKKYNWQPRLVDYRTSADVTSDKNNVVGYGCIGYFE